MRSLALVLVMLLAATMPVRAQSSNDQSTKTSGGTSSEEELPSVGITGEPAEAPPSESEGGPTPLAQGASPQQQKLSQQDRLKTVVDLSFTNANLKNVLNSLAKTYGLNIVAPDNLAGTITLTLREVTLEEGLRQLLKLNGFGFTLQDEIIDVIKLEQKRVAQLLYLKYLNPDTALEFIKPLAGENAVLKLDEASNAILVHDYLNKIDEMRSVLATVDQPPQQVLIESRLIDITHSDLDNLGLSFSNVGATIPYKSRLGPLITGPFNPTVLSSGTANLGSLSTATSATRTSHEFTFTLAQGSRTVLTNVDALIQNQRVKVLANPAVLTLNNVEAKITIGEKFPIKEQTQTSTGTLQTTRFVDIGTTLRVTPKINRDGFIQMHIHPEVSSAGTVLDAGPRITTREADTTVLVGDGQPIVIAGLLKEDITNINQRIPLLGHIPIIGLLFQNRSKDQEQKELVVVITPYIITVVPELKEPSTLVSQVAIRMDTAELFKEAQAMEQNQTLKAHQIPESGRYLEAIHLYQRAVARDPDGPYAEESLWRIGVLAREKVHNLDLAEAAFQRLVTRFPNGKYAARADRQVQSIRRERNRLGRVVKVESPIATFGFR